MKLEDIKLNDDELLVILGGNDEKTQYRAFIQITSKYQFPLTNKHLFD